MGPGFAGKTNKGAKQVNIPGLWYETEAGLEQQDQRGRFSAALVPQCMVAIEAKVLRLI